VRLPHGVIHRLPVRWMAGIAVRIAALPGDVKRAVSRDGLGSPYPGDGLLRFTIDKSGDVGVVAGERWRRLTARLERRCVVETPLVHSACQCENSRWQMWGRDQAMARCRLQVQKLATRNSFAAGCTAPRSKALADPDNS
jgi:hypothetical protein